ncbi:ABC transporter ATP-binding protein [Paenibacillus sp. YN15]|uniref:ABC transporter ATP-binding protein n=1 Tax=Paenibacillus sp. YN15 TaxID=1742774 RepID=UPI000DCD5321|nr:ABC transporter ATP-binding protein [Paenibacillus sp. YN15]RAV04627.1 ABC transporter ATP-binding protein [Paenibacillus sp. YN15]
MSYLTKYIRKYGRWFAIAVFFLTVEALCDLLLPTILSRVIDEGIALERMETVWLLGGLMLGITAVGALAACTRNVMASRVSQAFGTELRSDLFRKIQSLTFDSMDRFDRASLLTRLTNDVTQVQNFTNGLMRIFVKAPLTCIGSLIMAIRLNPRLSVILLIVVPLVGVLIMINMRIGLPRYLKVQKAMDRMNLVLREYLSGVRVVKAFNRFSYETDKMETANLEYQTRSIKVMRAMAAFNPAVTLTVNAGILAVLWYGGLRVDSGDMQVGHIVAFANYMTQILFSLMMISMVLMMFVRARASSQRISEVFADDSAMTWSEPAIRQPEVKGRIEFRNVTFTYGSTGPVRGKPVLNGINLVCEPGQTVGIIGSTGSGKSTLVNLIPRFYDVDSGIVLVNGQDVRSMDPTALRERIAVVPQKSVLFSGSIRDNIRWGKEQATKAEVEAAARIAGAHDFVAAFPEGYDTLIGQKGVNLSGGQKQRISIARGLIRRPDILILDDSTSAVDVITEARIKEALRRETRGMTCLLIAQRITSVMDADRILVLEHGEIAGLGTHSELLAGCRVYREIYASQTGKEAIPHVQGE